MYTKYPVRPSNHDRGFMMEIGVGVEEGATTAEGRWCPGVTSVYAAMGTWDAIVTTWAGRNTRLSEMGAQESGRITLFTSSWAAVYTTGLDDGKKRAPVVDALSEAWGYSWWWREA
jgi:hypothetical protein